MSILVLLLSSNYYYYYYYHYHYYYLLYFWVPRLSPWYMNISHVSSSCGCKVALSVSANVFRMTMSPTSLLQPAKTLSTFLLCSIYARVSIYCINKETARFQERGYISHPLKLLTNFSDLTIIISFKIHQLEIYHVWFYFSVTHNGLC